MDREDFGDEGEWWVGVVFGWIRRRVLGLEVFDGRHGVFVVVY